MSTDADTSPDQDEGGLGRRERRRHLKRLERALDRHARRMEDYRKAIAGGDPGDIESWLHALAQLRQVQAGVAAVMDDARALDHDGVATLLPGGRIDDIAQEIIDERLYLARCGRPFQGEDRARAELALAHTVPHIPLDLPVMPDPGQSAIDFIFPA